MNPQETEVERFLKPATVVDFYLVANIAQFLLIKSESSYRIT